MTAPDSTIPEAAPEARLEVSDGVATLTLDAPERYNALTVPMAREMHALFDEVDGDPAIGALVVTGAGKAFCSGAHLATLSEAGQDPLADDSLADLDALYGTFTRLGRVRVPTIAAVNGAAVGAGVNLMFAADLRIVAPRARILGGFLKRGLHPGGGHFLLLGRSAGRDAAAAVGLFGQEVAGEDAVRAGLAWEVVEPERLVERAREIARPIAADPALARAMATSFRAETEAAPMTWPAAVQFERTPQLWSMNRLRA